MQKQIAMAFPTPVGQFRVPDALATNQALARLILEREMADPTGDVYSNAGGWHSKADLLSWPDPAVVALRGWISEAVNHMVAATVELMRAAMGGRPRRRPGCTWRRGPTSAETAPTTGSTTTPADAGPGSITSRPAPTRRAVRSAACWNCSTRARSPRWCPPANPFGQKAIIRPEPGLMVVFPSWLYHCVNPYFGEGEQISISFNLRGEEALR